MNIELDPEIAAIYNQSQAVSGKYIRLYIYYRRPSGLTRKAFSPNSLVVELAVVQLLYSRFLI